MLAVLTDKREEVKAMFNDYDSVSLAVINSPKQIVLSGKLNELQIF